MRPKCISACSSAKSKDNNFLLYKQMKKRLVLCLLAIACVVSGAMAQAIAKSKANKDTEHWRYELQAAVGQAPHGCALVRVWSYSKNANVATMQAGKNAVHGIMFMGYPPSADGRRIPGRDPLITDRVKEEQYADFFDKFFADNGDFQRYVSYVGNGMPDQAPIKIGKEYKVPILVTVMVDELRKRLEQEGILAKMEEVMKGKMPTIMVVPSAMWCNKNGFLQVFDNQGKKEYVPDYEKALLSSTDLSVAINTINTLMANRGFPLKDLEASLKTIKSESAEDAMMTSKSGEAIAESPIDILRRVAKADIWVEIEWFTTPQKGGSQVSLTYSMNALDAYSDVVVAGVPPTTGQAEYTSKFQLPIAMESAIGGQFDPFCKSLMSYFDKLNKDGRAIKMRILTWDGFEDGLMTEYDGDELHEIIEDWVANNTMNGKFGSPDISPSGNRMTIEQVRIPLQNEKGRDLDARSWARGLQKMLRNKYSIESNLSSKGLGQLQLIIGGK